MNRRRTQQGPWIDPKDTERADALKQALADARKPKPCWDCGAVPCLSTCPFRVGQ